MRDFGQVVETFISALNTQTVVVILIFFSIWIYMRHTPA
jgi:hypothetical protein